jgi:hypothetical protein
MTDLFKNLRSSEQVAEETGLTVRRIQQLAPDLINKGRVVPHAGTWIETPIRR